MIQRGCALVLWLILDEQVLLYQDLVWLHLHKSESVVISDLTLTSALTLISDLALALALTLTSDLTLASAFTLTSVLSLASALTLTLASALALTLLLLHVRRCSLVTTHPGPVVGGS